MHCNVAQCDNSALAWIENGGSLNGAYLDHGSLSNRDMSKMFWQATRNCISTQTRTDHKYLYLRDIDDWRINMH